MVQDRSSEVGISWANLLLSASFNDSDNSKVTYRQWYTNEWACIYGGMILACDNCISRRKPCSNATLSTTNPKETSLGWNLSLLGERSDTNGHTTLKTQVFVRKPQVARLGIISTWLGDRLWTPCAVGILLNCGFRSGIEGSPMDKGIPLGRTHRVTVGGQL